MSAGELQERLECPSLHFHPFVEHFVYLMYNKEYENNEGPRLPRSSKQKESPRWPRL